MLTINIDANIIIINYFRQDYKCPIEEEKSIVNTNNNNAKTAIIEEWELDIPYMYDTGVEYATPIDTPAQLVITFR